jgi:eukaryotic-like serine/threonine-protein kinase
MKALATDDPDVIGEYRVRIKLGQGGMGRVYLGMSPAGRAVAVKVLHPELARDKNFLLRFEREIATARAVSGIYTAPVVATGLDDSPPWLATAFVPGPSLEQVVRSHGPLAETALWPLFAGLVEALRAIHEVGVVHRDLKPSNVLLATDGPRVIDFGISRATDGSTLTATGTVFGSPGYMSPEQAKGKATGPAADIFGLGCLVAYAASGTAPFGEGNAASVLYRVVHDEPDLTAVPERLREVVRRCLAKDEQGRPPLAVLAAAARVPGAEPAGLSFWPASVTSLIEGHQADVRNRLAAPGAGPAAAGGAGAPGAGPAGAGASGAGAPGAGAGGDEPTGPAPFRTMRETGITAPVGRAASARPAAFAGPPATVRGAAGVMYAGAAYAILFALFLPTIALVHSGRPLFIWPGHWVIHSLGALNTLAVADCAIQFVLWLWMAWACRNRMAWARAACAALFGCYTVGAVYALVRHTHDSVDTLGTVLFCITWLIGALATALLWRPQSSAYFAAGR